MILEIQEGNFTYAHTNQQVLKNISFRLEEQTIMTILGRNGIGKTTLIKCMAGILKWNSGKTLINGKKYDSVRDIKGIAFVPQAQKIAYAYSVRDVVIMGRVRHMGLLSIPSKNDRRIADRVMEEVGISHLAQRSCTQLSGGQLQLVLIARALASEPETLIMDEPESHLDFKNQFLMLDLIERLVHEKGLSCIINTHYPDHALRISDHTLLLGEDDFCFGPTQEVITEERMNSYFEVRSKITDVHDDSGCYKSFTILAASR